MTYKIFLKDMFIDFYLLGKSTEELYQSKVYPESIPKKGNNTRVRTPGFETTHKRFMGVNYHFHVRFDATDVYTEHSLGRHLYCTLRYLLTAGHRSAPNRRLLTSTWQLLLSSHSSSIFCRETGWERERQKRERQLFHSASRRYISSL